MISINRKQRLGNKAFLDLNSSEEVHLSGRQFQHLGDEGVPRPQGLLGGIDEKHRIHRIPPLSSLQNKRAEPERHSQSCLSALTFCSF